MTRDEVFLFIETEKFSLVEEISEAEVLDVEDVIDLITQIYNDFENRVCENCKYFNKNEYECKNKENYQYSFSELGENITSYMNVNENFGCNKFERKLK